MKTWLWNFLLFLQKLSGTISLNSTSLTPSPMSQELWPSTEAPWMSMTPPSLPLLHCSWSVQQPQAPKNGKFRWLNVFFFMKGDFEILSNYCVIYIYIYVLKLESGTICIGIWDFLFKTVFGRNQVSMVYLDLQSYHFCPVFIGM